MRLLLLPVLALWWFSQEARVPDTYPPRSRLAGTGGRAKGRIEGPLVWKSTIYPNTIRQYWIYIPAQYDPASRRR